MVYTIKLPTLPKSKPRGLNEEIEKRNDAMEPPGPFTDPTLKNRNRDEENNDQQDRINKGSEASIKPIYLASNVAMTPEELAAEYYIKSDDQKSTVSVSPNSSVQDLYNEYYTPSNNNASNPSVETGITPGELGIISKFGHGVKQGIVDVATTFSQLSSPQSRIPFYDYVDKKLPTEEQFTNEVEQQKQKNIQFGKDNPDVASQAGRFSGQVLATAPLIPAEGINAINVGMRATPIITASGTKIAAPFINKLGASVVTGGASGAIYGAATSGSNDEGVLKNSVEGLITGALAGPVIAAAGAGANKLIKSGIDLWSNLRVNKIVNATGMPANAVNNIIERLKDAGYTPFTAQQELNRLGPKATLADLDASLTTEASGLASLGEKPTAILKGRFANRASQASDETNSIVNQQLGPHVDLEQSKQNIVDAARTAVEPDYKAAHSSNQVLNVQPIIDNIDQQLETAVGSKASKLNEAKSYLFRNFNNAQTGETETIPRFSIKDLHETRIGLDDLLDRMPTEGTSQKSSAYRTINNVRSQVDDLLKQNHEMNTADTNFSQEMLVKDALQTGYDVLKKNLTSDQFNKQFANQTPEIQDAMRQGMRAFIGDYLEKGSQGEANAAQRLFSKKANNRANLEQAFGSQADGALDALEKEEAFRQTEKAVQHGSQTAERLAVQQRYQPKSGGLINSLGDIAKEAGKGIITDVALGSPAIATIGLGVKRAGGQALTHLSGDRAAQLAEGTADILSRSGNEAKNALLVASRVNKIRSQITKATPKLQLPTLKLPALFGGAVGENTKNTYDNYYK